MDCTDARERMELAAVEPGGLERLMAGDTADSAAVAGHLAACPACMAELAVLRRSAAVIREVVASSVDDALRERTLDYVRAVGRERRTDDGATTDGVAPGAEVPAPAGELFAPGAEVPAPAGETSVPAAAIASAPPARTRLPRAAAWVASIAATAVAAVALTAALTGPARDDQLVAQADEVRFLSRVSAMTVSVAAQPDAMQVALEGSGDERGSLLYSPSSEELVVTATGLASPPPDREYGCWLEAGASRTWVGRMRFGGDVAGWAGPVAGLGAIADDAVFRVYLEEAGGGTPDSEPVLWGSP